MRVERGFPKGVLKRLAILGGLAVALELLARLPLGEIIPAAVDAGYRGVGLWLERHAGQAASNLWEIGGGLLWLEIFAFAGWAALAFGRFVLLQLAWPVVADTALWLAGLPGRAWARLAAAREEAGAAFFGEPSPEGFGEAPRLSRHTGLRSPDPGEPVSLEEAAFWLDVAFPEALPGAGLAPRLAGLSRRRLYELIQAFRERGFDRELLRSVQAERGRVIPLGSLPGDQPLLSVESVEFAGRGAGRPGRSGPGRRRGPGGDAGPRAPGGRR